MRINLELGVFGKYVDPRRFRLSPATFVKTGMDKKIIQQLTEYGQNLATGPNEIAIANIIALVVTNLQQKPVPEAYMGYALYNSDSNLYEQGKVLLSKKSRNKHEELIQKIAVKKDGYIEAYLVNETDENVWFDQFRILSTGPLIVQETHYDPWGVGLSGLGYQYGGIKLNPYLNNGKEANGHMGVNLFDFGARMYDPAIGRWFVLDPMAEKMTRHSPYNYAFDNPIRFIDPDGMEPYSILGGIVPSGESMSLFDDEYKKFDKPNPDEDLIRCICQDSDKSKLYEGSTLPEVTVTASKIESNYEVISSIVKATDSAFNNSLDGMKSSSNNLKGFGLRLSLAATTLTGYDAYNEYRDGGVRNISVENITGFTLGFTGISSTILQRMGFGTGVVGRITGWAGLGYQSLDIQYSFYKSMNDLKYAPNYIDQNGIPYYGNNEFNWDEDF